MQGESSVPAPSPDTRESGILRPFLIAVFILLALLLHAYAITGAGGALFPRLSALLPHLYYIPIVLASIWYPRRGIYLIGLVVAVSIGMIFFGYANGIPFDPLILVYMAIYVWVVATTSVFALEQWKNLSRLLPSKKGHRATRAREERGPGIPPMDTADTIREEDLRSLLSTLEIPDPRVKEAAISSLGRSGNTRAVSPLISLMSDENRSIREASVRALGSLGEVAVEPLTRSLGDEDWHVRMGSAIALRIIGDPRGVDPLIRALSDENRFVRREAAKSLGRMGDRRATEALIAALEDRDTGVRIRVAAALGKIADPRAIAPLTRVSTDRNAELHEAVVEALSRIKNSITLSD